MTTLSQEQQMQETDDKKRKIQKLKEIKRKIQNAEDIKKKIEDIKSINEKFPEINDVSWRNDKRLDGIIFDDTHFSWVDNGSLEYLEAVYVPEEKICYRFHKNGSLRAIEYPDDTFECYYEDGSQKYQKGRKIN